MTLLLYSIGCNHSWEADNLSAAQKCGIYHGTIRFTTILSRASRWHYSDLDDSSQHTDILLGSMLILDSYLRLGIRGGFFL